MFRVIIAGGRDFNNYDGLAQKLDKLLANVTDEIIIVCVAWRRALTVWVSSTPKSAATLSAISQQIGMVRDAVRASTEMGNGMMISGSTIYGIRLSE